MRRVLALFGAGLFVLAVTVPTAAAETTGAVVVREHYQCIVGWDEASTQLDTGVYDESCLVTNVLQPNGTFTQVLRGQIPADQMDAFRAAGSPSSYAPSGCLVNYGWLMQYHQGEDWGQLTVFTESVRHFTPGGKMTEVCKPSIPADILAPEGGVDGGPGAPAADGDARSPAPRDDMEQRHGPNGRIAIAARPPHALGHETVCSTGTNAAWTAPLDDAAVR